MPVGMYLRQTPGTTGTFHQERVVPRHNEDRSPWSPCTTRIDVVPRSPWGSARRWRRALAECALLCAGSTDATSHLPLVCVHMPQGQEFRSKREREREGGGECVREMENFAYERETKQTAAPATYFTIMQARPHSGVAHNSMHVGHQK